MNHAKTKTEIVNAILNGAHNDPTFTCKNAPVDKIVFDWFVTGRSGDSLRITDSAKVAFEQAKIAHYDIDFSPPAMNNTVWSKYVLKIDKKIKCPYYIGIRNTDNRKKQTYIRLYDHRTAMMITLYGDLDSYLNSA